LKQITLTQGKIALVDDDVYEVLGHLKWYAQKSYNIFYAVRHTSRKEGHKTIRLHHLVVGKPSKGFEVDHKDGNGLNNQRDNLRIATTRQNQQNRKQHSNGRLVGASWHKGKNKWQVQIMINGKQDSLGYFNTEQEAHDVYMEALKN
jgi:hypothetical protein